MTLYALDDVDDAIDATRSFLWPFDRRRWLKLAVVVFFLGGTGSVNPVQFGGNTSPVDTPTGPGRMPNFSEVVGALGPAEWAVVAAVVGVVLLLGLLFAFVGAVMEFVFVESLRRERVSVREYWRERWRQGARLFGFRIAVGLGSLLVAGGTVAAAVWPLLAGQPGFSVPLMLLAVAVAVVVGVASAVVNGFTTQFVVPVMVLEDRTVLGAWRRFWPTLTGQWKQYLAYAVVRLVLAVAAAVVLGLVTGVGALFLAIPFVVVGVVGFLLLQVSGLFGGVVIGAAVALFVLALLVLSALVAVPVQTYLRYYALLVLGDTEDAFDLVAERRRAVRE